MSKHAFAGSVALLLASTALAHADVDARTIWSDWQETFARFGGTLTAASEDYSGDTLTLTDVSATTEVAGTASRAGYGTITMVERPDGTVDISLPEEVRSSQEVTVEDTTQTQDTTVTNRGLTIVASEAEGVRTYDMSADEIATTIEQTVEGAAPTVTTVTLSGLQSTYRSGIDGDADAFGQTMAAQDMALVVRVEGSSEGGQVEAGPEEDNQADGGPAEENQAGGGQVAVDYTATSLTGDISGAYGPPRTGPVTSLSDLGFTYDGTIRHAGSVLKVVGTSPQGDFAADGTSASAEMAFGMDGTSLTYAAASRDASMSVKVPTFPVPVDVSMAELSQSLTLPMGEPGAELPFALAVALRDLVVDDAIWSLFDPTGQLPRDPATLSVDMDGTALMNVDIFGDPEAVDAIEGAPGEVKTLNLKDLTLTAAGAALKGTGELAFPEPKTPPEPVGTIDLTLDGGFALVDKLVALGFIPAEQGAFVKGMAGAVTRSVGDDQLESTLEFTEGGGITANGLPLR